MRVISLDFETYCPADLRQVGADLYAANPDLVVTVVAWAIDDAIPVEAVVVPSALPVAVRNHLADPCCRLRAWNAQFEWLILHHHYGITLPWDRVDCTMQQALYAGLPASLGQAGQALGLPRFLQKDNTAHRLMLAMAKPRRGAKGGLWHEDDLAKLRQLKEYCRQDVVAEREIARRLPLLPVFERRVSLLDQETNRRGIGIDLELVRRLTDTARQETRNLDAACSALTSGEVSKPGSQTARLAQWLKDRGIASDGLDKDEVAKLLSLPIDDDAKQVLRIRQDVAKSSTRKLQAMARCADPADHRVRGQLLYYGASRTGRFAGRLIQVQNMPRLAMAKHDLQRALAGIRSGHGNDWLEALYGAPLEIVAQGLRSCLVPAPGRRFVVFDFKQIEARVLAWLAGQADMLEAFRRDEDIYTFAQKQIGLPTRQAGKVVSLAAGYGMGWKKFIVTAAKYGLSLDERQAKEMVHGWRDANHRVVELWHACEQVCRAALRSPDGFPKVVNAKLLFVGERRRDGTVLVRMRLPSGRDLFYRNVRLTADSEQRTGLTYDGVDQKTHQWGMVRTWGGKLAENCLSADTQVLTSRGWKTIVDVQADDWLWDGEEWVLHGGVAHQGRQETACLDGVWMTAEHKVLTENGWIRAAQSQGLHRHAVRRPDSVAGCGHDREASLMASGLRLWQRESHCRTRAVQVAVLRLPEEPADRSVSDHPRDVQASGLLGMASDARSLSAADTSSLEKLRRARDHGLSGMGDLLGVLDRHGSDLPARADLGANRQQCWILEGELCLGQRDLAKPEPAQQPPDHDPLGRNDRFGSRAAFGYWGDHPLVPDHQRLAGRRVVPPARRQEEVYDILDCGPRHRFTVRGYIAPYVVHNCVQAVSRDILVEAAIRVDDASLGLLALSAHDELVEEVAASRADSDAPRIRQLIETRPTWAEDLPIACEGGVKTSYGV